MKSFRVIGDFFIKDEEENLMEHIMPEYYVDSNMDKINVLFALRFLQNQLNELLHSFVNGGFSYKGYILYPLIQDVSKRNFEKINRLEKIAAFLNENGFDFSASIRAFGNDARNSASFAKILSSLYHDFSFVKGEEGKKAGKKICPEINKEEYKKDLNYIEPLFELKDYSAGNLRQYLSGFYLHGSFATRDYIKGWSDIDTLAIVSKKAISDPKKLVDLRKNMYNMRHFLYKIDPLQHHGSIVISEHDLQNYCNVYFPIEVFRYAKSFFKDKISDIRAREHSQEAISRLFWFVSYFRKLMAEGKYKMGSHELKNFLHCITLFPSMYLNAKGIFVYKKFSFKIAKKDFDPDDWKIIGDVELIRKSWKGFGAFPFVHAYSKINPLLSYQINSAVKDIFNNASKMNGINSKKLIEGMSILSEKAWSRIKNERI